VMSWPFGIAMGQVGYAWIAVHVDWRSAFAAASLACLLAAGALWWLYRPPPMQPADTSTAATMATAAAMPTALSRREWVLIVLAATVWGFFNAGYIVFLSFAPRVLEAAGYAATAAAGVISLASWVMIFSGAACGQLADRTGRNDLILYICMAVAAVALLLLPQPGWAVGLTLVLGLIGAAPAGLIMALTGQAMAPHKRAFGMGVFFSVFFAWVALAPPLAGALFDRSGNAFWPIVFAAALFAATGVMNAVFRFAQRRLPS
jgi:predicted MFS family arabinose efflux permease